jgi:hypothetical protein
MTNSKDSDARTEVGPQHTIGVTMEDLPKVERRALEEEMTEARRRKLACFQKKHARGEQENCPGHHDYGNCYTYGNC